LACFFAASQDRASALRQYLDGQIADSSMCPGADVMITIFCDFWHLSAKKLAFFSKTNVMIKFSQKLSLVLAKNANIFAKIFGKSI
jgi:hypothetical protein